MDDSINVLGLNGSPDFLLKEIDRFVDGFLVFFPSVFELIGDAADGIQNCSIDCFFVGRKVRKVSSITDLLELFYSPL